MSSSESKIAMVTGAGSGIGRSVTVTLLQNGYSIVLAGRTRESLEETVGIANSGNDNAVVVPADITDPESVSQLFNLTKEKYGRLDLLFNNAGLASRAVSLEDLSVEEWQDVVDVNLTGVFLCTQEAFRIMKTQRPRGGRIINNGSISAHTPRPLSAPYTATKHGITGLTRSTALDGRAWDIACGQIDIGNAATDMTAVMSDGILQANGDVAPEPTMNVDDVGSAVLYMASLPLSANILFMTIMATSMPFVGRG